MPKTYPESPGCPSGCAPGSARVRFERASSRCGAPFALVRRAYPTLIVFPHPLLTMDSRRPSRRLAVVALPLLLVAFTRCQAGPPPLASRATSDAREPATREPLRLPLPLASAPVTEDLPTQREFMRKSALAAWEFVVRSRSQAGFVGATDSYPYMTVWDLASTLAATYSARELGLITPAQYHAAIDRSLTTVEGMTLFDNAAFNKLYAAKTGAMVDRKNQTSSTGYGWSVLDHGRLLVWLKIIGQSDPGFATRTQAIVSRLDMKRLVSGGYLRGEDIDPANGTRRSYQEGRVGYEQYAAEGFALWGTRAEQALDFGANGRPVVVNDQTVLADVRKNDLLTSEPFVMMGLELGWPGTTWRPLSLSVLAAQEARFKRTGIVTMISEDAIPDPPAYFYYYLLYYNGMPFAVTSPGGDTASTFPRWVSAKAAFGYHALAPSDYTWRALQTVKWGMSPGRGWTAGVYEGTRNSTKSFNLNTAAIVLESAAYMQRGCAFIERSCEKSPAAPATRGAQ